MDFELETNWDYIIIGTGMSGSTFGYAVAATGKRVLFLEKGLSENLSKGSFPEDKWTSFQNVDTHYRQKLKSYGRFDEYLYDASHSVVKKFIPLLGQGAGGSSLLYGAALERFFPEDFKPEQFIPADLKSSVQNWPIQYQDLQKYYKTAEQLYSVYGSLDPLRKEFQNPDLKSCGFTKEGQALFDLLTSKGSHPYRLPVGHVPRQQQSNCLGCQAVVCQCDEKSDAFQKALKPALQKPNTYLLSEALVTRINANRDLVQSVQVKKGDKYYDLKAKYFFLAAGALKTPELLLNSKSELWPQGLANRSGQVGKNFCRHFMDLIMIDRSFGREEFLYEKELAFNDFYFYENYKLGTVQSLGNPPSVMATLFEMYQEKAKGISWTDKIYYQMVKTFGKPIMKRLFETKMCLAVIMEDTSFADNQVFVNEKGALSFKYHIHEFDKKRIQKMRQLLKSHLKDMHPTLHPQAENNQRLAHASGTCRMGDDSRFSVVDKYNRVHDLENLYVLDASFFPSSAGINPALTLAANALRVSEKISSG